MNKLNEPPNDSGNLFVNIVKHKTAHVTVCFKNFDNISKKLILSRLNEPQYSIEQMKSPEDVDICIFNQEYSEELGEIESLRINLERLDVPMMLLTAEDISGDSELFKIIKKPIKNRKLSDYLYLVKDTFYALVSDKLKRKVIKNSPKIIYHKHLSNAINPTQIQFESNRFYAQKYVGLNTDIDFSDPEQLAKIQMNPHNYFFYYLKQAFALSKDKGKMTCVKTVYGTFYVDAKDKLIMHHKTADDIFNIHKIPFYKDTEVFVLKLKRSELNELKELNQFDYEPFVWLSCIHASKGKMPMDVNFNAPIKLVAWPDLTKLAVFKHAIRIIALWSRGVYSLKHTGQLLNIPQRYPLTVYSALNALGLIDQVKKR